MTGQQNAPRDQRRASRNPIQTTSQRTGDFDPSRCDASCGSCWVTYVEDQRWCESQHLDALRRDLAEALAGGGQRG